MTTSEGADRQVQAISSDEDVVRVRQLVRTAAVAAKLSLVDQTKVVTAASELARNTLVYGGGGSAEVCRVVNGSRHGVRIACPEEVALRMGFISPTQARRLGELSSSSDYGRYVVAVADQAARPAPTVLEAV